MKRILKMTALAFVLVLGSSVQNSASAQYDNDYDSEDRNDVSYQTFYDELSPHGRWVDYPGQGYVWIPDAGPDFRPYSSNGHWVWTDNYEWMWVSEYDWGWAPFHYGRWDNDPSYGWYWVPGYEWSPAWVAWRDGGDYYGWAPLRPGIHISINFNIGRYSPPNDYWCFTPRRYITSRNIFNHCIDRRQNVTIINQTTIINYNNYNSNYGFRSGPRRNDVERYTGRINPVRFRQSNTPGRTQFRNNEVSVYRPNVRRDDNRSFSPRQFERYDRQNNNSTVRSNDNGFRRNDNSVNRNNNLPSRQQGPNDNSRFERRADENVRQPQNNNSNRQFDRTENRNGQPNRTNEVRTPRPTERPVANPNNNNGNRRFERTGTNDQPVRNNEVRVPRPTERTDRNTNNNGSNDSRKFERRSADNGNSTTPARQPNREIRPQNNNQPQRQPSPQVEQRRVQEQPRKIERRQDDNNSRQNGGNGESRGSKKRF